MTSSLRNSIHRRNHKERSQLAHRSKLGLLEKHKDYVKRARDYHSKQDRLNRLKQKVTERNKDEFYFSMTKERTKGGVHIQDRGNVALPTDMVKVLKTQDENYIRTMRASNMKKIDKLKNKLTEMADLLKSNPIDEDEDLADQLDESEIAVLRKAGLLPEKLRRKRKHILFAESAEEASRLKKKGKGKEVAQNTPTTSNQAAEEEEDLGWKSAAPKKSKKSTPAADEASGLEGEWDDAWEDESATAAAPSADLRRRILKELSARLERDRMLRYTEREFEMQRLMMGKGATKKIQGVEKVEGDSDDDEETQDEIDARRGRRRKPTAKVVDEETYRPRVYKWRLERKR